MRDQKVEVLAAMDFYGIDPEKPVTDAQFDKIREFVWRRRKEREAQLRREAKHPTKMDKLVRGSFHADTQSKPEDILLWAMSQRSLLIGEFKPQLKVGPYFLDFGFESVKLGVEVDGRDFHSAPADQERDRRRGAYLAKCGWTILRFSASDVMNNSMTVSDKISVALSRLQKHKGIKEAWE